MGDRVDSMLRTGVSRRKFLQTLAASSSTLGLTTFSPLASLVWAARTDVVVAMNNEPNTMDPHFSVGRHTETFQANIYDSLLKRDRDNQFIPGLAESWKQLDATIWQFKLRRDVKFHNGEPFTAEAVKFTFERVTNHDNKATTRPLLEGIAKVEVIDDVTVNIVTKQPDIMLLARLSELYGSILPPNMSKRPAKTAWPSSRWALAHSSSPNGRRTSGSSSRPIRSTGTVPPKSAASPCAPSWRIPRASRPCWRAKSIS